MIYNIETLSKSVLLRLIMGIHEHYQIDGIDDDRIREELYKTETLERGKQIAKDIATIGYSSGKLWEAPTQIIGNKDKDETKEPSDNNPLSGGQEECPDNSSDIHLSIVGRIDLESINQRMRPEKKKNIRLNKVATELNVGIKTIVEFLAQKGQFVEAKPNTKITTQQYNLVLVAFGNERVVKEKSIQKESIRTGGNRVILATKNIDNKYDANNKKEQVEDNGDNNPKPMSKNARKKERRRAERRAMMATKVISE